MLAAPAPCPSGSRLLTQKQPFVAGGGHWPLSTSSRLVSSCFEPTLGKPDRPDQALLATTGDGANALTSGGTAQRSASFNRPTRPRPEPRSRCRRLLFGPGA